MARACASTLSGHSKHGRCPSSFHPEAWKSPTVAVVCPHTRTQRCGRCIQDRSTRPRDDKASCSRHLLLSTTPAIGAGQKQTKRHTYVCCQYFTRLLRRMRSRAYFQPSRGGESVCSCSRPKKLSQNQILDTDASHEQPARTKYLHPATARYHSRNAPLPRRPPKPRPFSPPES